jgi:hypothetical protein
MMRRAHVSSLSASALALLLAVAVPASAQMPPAIQKPIDAAKRAANKTSTQVNNEQKAGNDTKAAAMPGAAAQSGAAQRGTAAPKGAPQKGAATAAAKQAMPSAADSAKTRGSVSQNGVKGSVTFYREVFTYEGEGRRDPFLSLMTTGELRPMISDLTLVGIIYDETGRNSVAVLVDASQGGQTYRKKVGDVLGRMKVVKITEDDITLNVDEFGFARQETLLIDRNPRTGAGAPARRPQ